jgi:hypothetical protein
MHNQNATATATFAPCEVAEFFAQQGEEFAAALQRVMDVVEKIGVVFSPFGDPYRARYDGWFVPADAVISADLADGLESQSFYQWVGSLGYDTCPYYRTPDGRVRLPVAHTIGFADGRGEVDYGGDPVSLRTIVETLHTLGVEIVVPDYAGSHHCGNQIWTPTKHGAWVQQYTDLRD